MKSNFIALSDWKQVRLEDISYDFVSGGTPSTSKIQYWDGDIHWMRSAHISGKEVFSGEKLITKNGLENSATNIVPKDNLLIATRVSLGNVVINRVDMAISQDLTGIILNKEKTDENFIYYLLKTKENEILSIAQGTTIKGILRDDLKKIRISLPPLDEQRGIVEVLGTVDECIRLTDTVLERAEELKRGLMQQLLTRGIGHTEYKETPLGKIPKKWKIMSLGDPSLSKIIMGQSPPSSSYNSKGDGLPFLQGNAEFGYKFPKTILYTTKPQKIAQENDILVSVRAPVGELNYTPYRLCIGRGLSAIRVNPTNLSNDFIYYYLKQNINRLHALSTGSTFKAIRKEEIYSFKLPIPSLVEQYHIIKILNNINDKILNEKEKQQHFIKIKQGLMQLLLSGNIRVELKGDELHRIRDSREANN